MTRSLSVFVICGLFVSQSGLLAIEPAPDTRRPDLRPFQLAGRCSYDRVMVGPDGHQVVAWRNDARNALGLRLMLPPSKVIVGRMYPMGHSSADSFSIVAGAGLRLFPIRWSTSGDRLYIRVREPRSRILAISTEGRLLEELPLPLQWASTDINAITHGGIAVLKDLPVLQAIARIDGKELIRGSATLGKTVVLLGVRRTNLELVRLESKKLIGSKISSGHTRVLAAFPTASDYPAGISYLGAAQKVAGEEYLPYQLPIVDLESGRVAGKFSPTRIHLSTLAGLQEGIAALHRRLKTTAGILLDVSLSGETLIVLASDSEGHRLIRVGSGEPTEKLICRKSAYPTKVARGDGIVELRAPPQPKIFAIDRQGRATDRQGSPILLQYSLAGRGPRDVVLDFHGGPGGSLADEYWAPRALRLLRPNRDVIAVEYAGSLGGGEALTNRLAKHGMAALDEDMEAVARWLTKQGYRRVYLLAGSFGSVPAMIVQSRYPSLFEASFHIAPVLKLQNPEVWVKRRGDLTSVNSGTQLAYELESFGGPEGRRRFAQDLSSMVAGVTFGSKHHIYFGGFDEISKPEHLPAGARPSVLSIPRAGHTVLGARSEVWREIEKAMQ